MTIRKAGLGKGLNALLGTGVAKELKESTITVKPTGDNLRHMRVDQLQPGIYQPRRHMDDGALAELAESIRHQGIIQPIIVRPIAGQRYEILAGERRWRAAQLADLLDVPVVVRDISDEAAMAVALIENIQREDLNPIEQALALQRLQDEFKLTHEDIAKAVGKSRVTVTNLLRLLNLREDVRVMLEQHQIEMGHARALLALSGSAQSDVAKTVASKGLSVRETEALIRAILSPVTKAKVTVFVDPNIASVERDISEKLGAKVNLQHQANGQGRLVINYHSLDELEGILQHIR